MKASYEKVFILSEMIHKEIHYNHEDSQSLLRTKLVTINTKLNSNLYSCNQVVF